MNRRPGNKRESVSVVIATLAGPTLAGTIDSIFRGDAKPAEVIIAVPPGVEAAVPRMKNATIRVLTCPGRGQVAQRCFGFAHASHPLVLQLDDDIRLDPGCLSALIECLKRQGKRAAVAPALWEAESDSFAYNPPGDSALERLHLWLANGRHGFQAGRFALSGINFGPAEPSDQDLAVDWLPGGCVLHWRENLILENYYPFTGKAYAEDLLHSVELQKRGIRLFLAVGARAWFSWGDVGPRAQWRSFFGEYRAFRELAARSGRPPWRIHAVFLLRGLVGVGQATGYLLRRLARSLGFAQLRPALPNRRN